MSDLLPCPMCGSDAEIERMGTNRVSMIIRCTDCGLSLESGETFIGPKCRWNTRATPPGMIKTEESHQRVIDAVTGARKSWLKQGMLPDGYKVVPVEPLQKLIAAVDEYINYDHNGDPFTEDARVMGEMELNEINRDGTIAKIKAMIETATIE